VVTEPRIAIVSDPLVQRGGAERVVEALAQAFPQAPIFALLYSAQKGPSSLQSRVRASWLNRVPSANRRHRLFLPLYRQAIESFDLSEYDVIVSSHHTVGKGVLTRADQVHVCYCHTPMRALWERPAAELATLPAPARPLAAAVFSHLREWDFVTGSRVQHYVANSRATQRRIATYYRRESTVIPPPIQTDFFTPGGDADDYYLVASRPVPYKRVDIAIAATAQLKRKLKIVGGKHAVSRAAPHVELLGSVSDEELRALMRGARALLFPQHEDFGMTPLEMNACGRPVIAYGRGGALDTVIDGWTGILVSEQTVPAFVRAIERFEQTEFDPAALRAHALAFSGDAFVERMRSLVTQAWMSSRPPGE
jgi:glycosyltransferase involved in cell wall biosynthesis